MSGAILKLPTSPDLVPILGTELDALSSRHKDETASRLWELVVVVGVDAYGVKVKACAERLGMNAGSVSRALARASARERLGTTSTRIDGIVSG
jgi:hypothetical protein